LAWPALVEARDTSGGQWWGSEVQLRQKLFDIHTLILGGEFRDNLRQDQDYFTETPPNRFLADRRRSLIWGPYFQGELALLTNLTLNAGVRYDHYESFGGTANPRAGLIYTPWPATTFKLLYGRAFRAPNMYELYYNDGGVSSMSNPALQPEQIHTYELVWEQALGEHWRASASGYYYRINDLISQTTNTGNGLIVYENLDSIDAQGVEFELDGKWPHGFRSRMSYAMQRAENSHTGELLSNSPRHLAKLALTAPVVTERLFAGFEMQYAGPRKTRLGNYADAFWLANFTLFSRHLAKDLEVSASIYNLFNTHYGDPGGAEHLQDILLHDGRSFRLKLAYRF
jgi:iron complex outermembrane receptor protein